MLKVPMHKTAARVGMLLLASGLALSPAVANACDNAERLRLSDEAKKLAQRNAWSGVERTYEAMQKTRCELNFDEHFLGAQAARTLGKVFEMYERLTAAREIDPQQEIVDSLNAIETTYGRVHIKGDARRRPELNRPSMPFAPDQRKAIEWAKEVVAGTGSFRGMLPQGEYTVGDRTFTVEAGADWQVLEVGRIKGKAAEGVVRSEGAINYAGLVATVGPNFLLSGEPGKPVENDAGIHQFAPHNLSASGMSVSLGGELGLTYKAPEAGIAATIGYMGGYGNDTLHGFNGWLAGVIRPGELRVAAGPSYTLITGKGTGVATWFDVDHNKRADANETLRYQGASWGGGIQASVGYGVLDLDSMRGFAELHGAWHTDGARSFSGVGLRVGVVPTVPRFKQ